MLVFISELTLPQVRCQLTLHSLVFLIGFQKRMPGIYHVDKYCYSQVTVENLKKILRYAFYN